MKKENLKKEIIESGQPKLYIFYNVSKNQGIKRLKPIKPSTIQLGEIVKISNDYYILLSYLGQDNKCYDLQNVPDFNSIKEQIELGTFNPSSIKIINQ